MEQKIKIVKRASGYQARYETANGFPARITGCATKEDALRLAKEHIERTKATKVV